MLRGAKSNWVTTQININGEHIKTSWSKGSWLQSYMGRSFTLKTIAGSFSFCAIVIYCVLLCMKDETKMLTEEE